MTILRRKPDERFSEVVPEWVGKTAVLLAGGPSLTPEQVALVKVSHDKGDTKVIAVNDTYLLAPWADVNYFADSRWWEWQTAGVSKPLIGLTAGEVCERFATFAGQKCSIQRSGANIVDEKVHILRNFTFPNHGHGISLDPGALVTGRNSGYQALNLAVLAGSRRIILLGYDGRPAADGRRHWFGEHPKASPIEVYEEMRKTFAAGEAPIAAAGVVVYNCSPGSGLDNFPKCDLSEVLP